MTKYAALQKQYQKWCDNMPDDLKACGHPPTFEEFCNYVSRCADETKGNGF